MSDNKIIPIVDVETRRQTAEMKQQFENDVQLAVTLVEDELITVREELSALCQRVRKLEEKGGVLNP